jgi:hypothetical protein
MNSCHSTLKALKPNKEVVAMFEWFASKADFSRKEEDLIAVKGGWGGGSTWPTNSGWPYGGFECG